MRAARPGHGYVAAPQEDPSSAPLWDAVVTAVDNLGARRVADSMEKRHQLADRVTACALPVLGFGDVLAEDEVRLEVLGEA
jgi:hypothetical protein